MCHVSISREKMEITKRGTKFGITTLKQNPGLFSLGSRFLHLTLGFWYERDCDGEASLFLPKCPISHKEKIWFIQNTGSY